jgi:regulator of sigma E protease
MVFLVKAAQLILSLSILVIIHEFGHFIFARIFKTRVEKFYLFFDPWFSLFKFKRGETEYGVGWIPLGGYVKISGMIDESMDKEAMKQEPKPWEFRSKPSGQRLLIMLGGVLFNVLFAFLIYSMVLWLGVKSIFPSRRLNMASCAIVLRWIWDCSMAIRS